MTTSTSDWLPGALAGFVSGTASSLLVLLVGRWLARRGKLRYYFNSREPERYVMRGNWDDARGKAIFDIPRFLEFRIPIVIENTSDVEQMLSIKRVHFSGGPPVFHSSGWELQGECLDTLGFRILDASGNTCDPVRVPARGFATVTLVGTASTPVFHDSAFHAWRCVFIDMIGTPKKRPPLMRIFDEPAWTLESNIQPTFPVPAHYRHW